MAPWTAGIKSYYKKLLHSDFNYPCFCLTATEVGFLILYSMLCIEGELHFSGNCILLFITTDTQVGVLYIDFQHWVSRVSSIAHFFHYIR